MGFASQLVLAVVGLWVARFLLHRLGQSEYGLWLVAMQLLAYLALTDLGVIALLPREVAYSTGRGTVLADIVGQTVRIVSWQVPLVALVAGGIWLFLPHEWDSLRGPLGVVLVAFVSTFPLRIPAGVLSGLQDLAFLAGLQTAATLAGIAVTVAMVVGGFGLHALAFGWTASQLVLGVGAFVRLRLRFAVAIPSALPRLTWSLVRHRFGQGMWVSLSQVAVVLLNATDAVIIGKVLGPAAVVPYACTAKLILFLGNQPQLLMQTAQPGLAELRASTQGRRVFDAATALTQAVLIFTGAIGCGVIAVNHGFVRLWIGEAQWGGYTLTSLIILRLLLAQWNLTTATTIFAFGYERRLALVGIADGMIFVALTTALVARVGVIGAPLAGVVTLTFLSLPFNLHALGRETAAGVTGLLRELWPWAWRFALGFGFAAVLARVWEPTSIIQTVAAGTIAVGAYAALTVHQFLKPPLSRYLHPALAARLQQLPVFLRGVATP